ncbi:MAG: ABC-type transport auxiliary lipoprotein family protein [Lysobacteraceae bacterium]|jgi:cholesterol transport system auxiliary component|nr:ABC-type transport auxiliary lipoprotein family protein [Xanthomonadaceae bacterium]MCZ8319131.1 ABC-type transport auxiliary lipoprotein family protein [Silanimonas sp.]
MSPRPSLALLVVGAFAATGLTGCLSLGGDKADLAVYAPVIAIAPEATWPSVPLTLAIAEPQASTALDSVRIAVRPEPGRLQVYAGAVWSDRAPALVQSALVDAFDQAGRFKAVTRTTGELATDLRLDLDLRQFEAVYADDADTPTATVVVQATLVDVRRGTVLATRLFRAGHVAEREKLKAVVPGFEAALSEVARAMVPWVLASTPPTGTSG